MIRICHVVNVITGKTDGVFAHIKSLVRNLNKNKFEQILIYQGGGIVKEQLNIKIYEVPELSKKFSVKAIIKIIKICRENNIDIIQAHVVKPYLLSGVANFILNKKLIFNYHGLFIKQNKYYNSIGKVLLYSIHIFICLFRKVDLALAPSIYSKKILLEETQLFPKVMHYYNGFNCNSLIKIKKSVNKIRSIFTIGIVARLEIQKRLDRALIIIKKLTEHVENFRVVIYGDGPLESKLKSLADELEITNFIEFRGYYREIIEEYKNFDILFFTSDWEGLPLSVFEAMANAVPIVSTNVGGIPEILIENNCGFVFDKNNIDEGTNYILKLMNDANLREKMGENGRKAIETKYNIENFIQSFEEFYSDLMNEK